MSSIPRYVARKIEQGMTSKSTNRIGKHISLPNFLIGSFGAGLGYMAGLGITAIDVGGSVASYLISGDMHGAQRALLQSDAYKLAGEFALAGYIGGSVLANKIKEYVRGILK